MSDDGEFWHFVKRDTLRNVDRSFVYRSQVIVEIEDQDYQIVYSLPEMVPCTIRGKTVKDRLFSPGSLVEVTFHLEATHLRETLPKLHFIELVKDNGSF